MAKRRGGGPGAARNQGGMRDGKSVTQAEAAAIDKKAAEKAKAKAERKAKNQKKREVKKAAVKLVLDIVKGSALYGDGDEGTIAAVKLLTPGQRFGGTRTGVADIMVVAFTSEPVIDEDTIWSEYKLGRKEMRGICVNLIKKREPEKRMWISFDADEGMYTLEGEGADAPEGWLGYTPVDMEELEI